MAPNQISAKCSRTRYVPVGTAKEYEYPPRSFVALRSDRYSTSSVVPATDVTFELTNDLPPEKPVSAAHRTPPAVTAAPPAFTRTGSNDAAAAGAATPGPLTTVAAPTPASDRAATSSRPTELLTGREGIAGAERDMTPPGPTVTLRHRQAIRLQGVTADHREIGPAQPEVPGYSVRHAARYHRHGA